MLSNNLVIANFSPSEAISNKNMGIFVVDQAPMKIRILLNLTPLFINTAATGKAPYKGPAAADPINIDRSTPLIPDPSPIYLTIICLGTHTSNNPSSTNIGGRIKSISFKVYDVTSTALAPSSLFTRYKDRVISRITKTLKYLLKYFLAILYHHPNHSCNN